MAPWRTLVVMLVCGLATARGVDAQVRPPVGGWVVIPVDEYQALRSRARGTSAPASTTSATISRLDYALQHDGDLVAGQARLTIDVSGSGWVRVPLPAGLAVREARLDGQPLVLDPGPPAALHLSRPGRSTLSLEIVVVPEAAGRDVTLSLPASTAAITRVALALPGATHDVTATGGVVWGRDTTSAGTTWTVHGQPATPLVLAWATRVEDARSTLPLRVGTRLDTTVAVRDALMQIVTGVTLEVRQGTARDVIVDVPPGVTVTNVGGPAVDDWRIEGAGVRVVFIDPVTATTAFAVQADAPAPGGAVSVPLLRVRDAERETGAIVIDVGNEAEVTGATTAGLDPLVEAGHGAATGRTFALQPGSAAMSRQLVLQVARYAAEAVPIATVDEARYRVLAGEGGRLLVEAQYHVRNNQRSAVGVTLPGGTTLWSVRVGNHVVTPGQASGGQLVVPIGTASTGAEPVTALVSVLYLQTTTAWTAGTRTALTLPTVDLPVARSGVLVHHPPALRPVADGGTFRPTDDLGAFQRPFPASTAASLVTDMRPGVSDDVAMLIARAHGSGVTANRATVREPFEFPAAGPAAFFQTELTPEGVPPVIQLALRAR